MSSENIVGAVGLLGLLLYLAWDMPPAIKRTGGSQTLRYARWLRWYSLFAALGIPLGITVLAIVFPPKDDSEEWAIAGVYALFAVPSTYLLLESIGFAVTITDKGLECRSGWHRRRFVPWKDVTGLTTSKITKHFVLLTRGGYRYRVPALLVPGLSDFLEAVHSHLSGSTGQHA
jgi:hypothetical protein